MLVHALRLVVVQSKGDLKQILLAAITSNVSSPTPFGAGMTALVGAALYVLARDSLELLGWLC